MTVRIEKTSDGRVVLDYDRGTFVVDATPDEAREIGNALVLAAIGDPGFVIVR